jgi:hypothetical protein
MLQSNSSIDKGQVQFVGRVLTAFSNEGADRSFSVIHFWENGSGLRAARIDMEGS